MSVFDLNSGGAVVEADGAAPALDSRLLQILMQMQAGQDMLTDILVEQKAKIAILEMDIRKLKARTDTPKRPAIVFPGETKWPH